MSSGAIDDPSTTTTTFSQPPQHYFCYQCNRTVSLSPSSSSSDELACPHCNGGFLEEVENPNPSSYSSSSPFAQFFSPPPSASAADHLAPFAPFFFPPSSSSAASPIEPIDLSAIFGGGAFGGSGNGGNGGNQRSPFQETDVFNPFQFLQSYLQTMRAGGANIQFVIENANPEQGGGGGNFRLPSNLGDYFFGPGLEQLIQQLAENDPNRYGTPPASKTAVEGLPIVKVTEELLLSDSSQCAVCMDEFQLGAEAKQMPCKHVFHSDCILPWLELHNSCPVCRHELPTDDPDYEQRIRNRRENLGSGDGAGGGDNGDVGGNGNRIGGDGVSSETGSQNDRTVERSFNISLPWPFRNVGSSAEGSNASGDGNEANPRRRGNPDFGSETRTEDLD
ncbi:E3 ubiquitin-protein ligase RING1-like [Chenopodium quinoa]|uniref:E3 ubiquitin-protein ligase RING1-like n=1 Tax=Chenopodium quinoa TaxID=63459 RepID=UPI000B7701DD|nr:E3 ubiquitin-protein ligase RING1-like [Chenopodium quinoa]